MAKDPEYLFENFPPIVIDVMDVDRKVMRNQHEDIGRAAIYLKDSCSRYIKAGDEN